MKNLNITYGDKDFARLSKAKKLKGKNKTWERFVLDACCLGVSVHKRVSSGSPPNYKQKPLNSRQENFTLLRREE